MVILLDENKHLKITKPTKVYKFETGVDDMKFLLPKCIDNVDVLNTNCVVLITLETEKESKGLYKYVSYEDELYKDRIVARVPITSALTMDVSKVNVWLLLLGEYDPETKTTDFVVQTDSASFSVEDNGSKYSESEEVFDEVWEHSSIDKLMEDVGVLATNIESIEANKADGIEVTDDNKIILKSGDGVLAQVKLSDDVVWEELK